MFLKGGVSWPELGLAAECRVDWNGGDGGSPVENYGHGPGERVVTAGRAKKAGIGTHSGGRCVRHTLGQGQVCHGQWCPIQVQLSGWEPTAELSFCRPRLGMQPSGHHIVSGIFVPRKTKMKGRKMGDQPPLVLGTQGTWCPQGGKAL